MLRIQLLKQFGVTAGDKPIGLVGLRLVGLRLALLLHLALNRGKHTRDDLIFALWSDGVPRTYAREGGNGETDPRGRLRSELAKLRRALRDAGVEDRLNVDPVDDMVALTLQRGDWCDVHAILDADLAQLPQPALIELAGAYGPPAPEVRAAWSETHQQQLDRGYARLLDAITRTALDHKHADVALDWATRWLNFAPDVNEPYIRLMHAHALAGDLTAVAAVRDRWEQHFAADADGAIAQAHKRFAQLAEDTANAKPAAANTTTVYATRMFGREHAAQELTALLRDPAQRLVTLHGMGGIGKTRLANHVANAVAAHFEDGVFLIEMSGSVDAASLAAHIAQQVRFKPYGGAPLEQQLAGYLSEKRMLLVWDSVEHVLGDPDRAAVTLLDKLLHAAPQLKVLATSRERLMSPFEHLYEVEGLGYPAEDDDLDAENYDAVRLFRDRAAKHRGRRPLDPLTDVVKLCRLVQGLPLALELAASWVGILSARKIAEDIAKALQLEAGDGVYVSPQHRSLRATIEYSWGLLDRDERETFLRLCLFRESFDTENALAVAHASGSRLMRLVDVAFVQRRNQNRCGIHESLRQFGREVQQTAWNDVQKASVEVVYATHYAGWLFDNRSSVELIDFEWSNATFAFDLLVSHGLNEQIPQFAESAADYVNARGRYAEATAILSVAVEMTRLVDDKSIHCRLLLDLCRYHLERANYGECSGLLAQGTELAYETESSREIAFALFLGAWREMENGSVEKAENLVVESLEIGRDYLHDQIAIQCLQMLGRIYTNTRRYDLAQQALDQAHQMLEGRDFELDRIMNMLMRARVQAHRSEAFAATSLAEAALLAAQKCGNPSLIASACNVGAQVRYYLNSDLDRGLELVALGQKQFHKLDNRRGIALMHQMKALIRRLQGDVTHAVSELEFFTSEAKAIGDQWLLVSGMQHLGDCYSQLGDHAAARRAWQNALPIALSLNHPAVAVLRESVASGP